MFHALRTTLRLGIVLALAGVGAPVHAGEADGENAGARSWTAREGGAAGPLIHLPPVGNQRDSFTCVSFAVRTVAAFHRRRLEPLPASGVRALTSAEWEGEFEPSVTYLHNFEIRRLTCEQGGVCDGAAAFHPSGAMPNVHRIFFALTSLGAPTAHSAPFTTNVAALPSSAQREEAQRLRCCWQAAVGPFAPQRLTGDEITEAALRRALRDGPVVAMMNVFTDFDCSGGRIYGPRASADRRGRHALVVVGYDPDLAGRGPAFQFMNSWGDDWRDHGMVWIRFADFGLHPGAALPVIDSVWVRESSNAAHDGPRGRSPCEPCAKAATPLSDAVFGPPRVESQAWHDDGLDTPCGAVPVRPIEAPHGPSAPDHDKPADRTPQLAPEVVAIRRKTGVMLTLVAPPIPLVPALFDAKIRYFVGSLEAARRAPRGRPDEVVRPVDPSLGYRFVFASLDNVQRADPNLGPDPEAIGAWQDRARFEVADEQRLGSGPLLVRIEVRYPGDDERGAPRLLREYVLQIAP